jgi:hypothetical protein
VTELMVGCPVRSREWIIEDWFDHVEMAAVELGLAPMYVFVGDRHDPTLAVIEHRCARQDRYLRFGATEEDGGNDERVWNPPRYAHMARVRNQLLDLVRHEQPRWFLSVDSDILIHHQALAGLIEGTERFGAIGGATYMTPTTTQFPNCGWVRGMAGLSRQHMEHQGVIPVGVIMALKLMTPAAYAVDYEPNPQGEDIGWSLACERAGVRLGWDNRFVSKHVMSPDHLKRVDARVGW